MSHFLLDTDHPIDKIAWMWEGELALDHSDGTGAYWGATFFDHNIGAQLFVKGIWSVDDWNTTYAFGDYKRMSELLPPEVYSYCRANSTRVAFGIDFKSESPLTAKVRLWGFVYEDETKGLELNPTAALSRNRYALSTDFNYPRLYAEGYATKGGSSLGYNFGGAIPYVDVWYLEPNSDYYEYLDLSFFLNDVDTQWDAAVIQIYRDQVLFDPEEEQPYTKYYYRIYEP